MTKAIRKPLRIPKVRTENGTIYPIRENQGMVHPHKAIIIHHRTSRSIEETFAIGANRLFEAKIKEGFVIIRGILDLDTGFLSNERILDILKSGDHLEPIMSEPSRMTVKTTTTCYPRIFHSMTTHIRDKLDSCLAYMNRIGNENPRLDWTDRYVRQNGYNTLIITHPVPEPQRNQVQLRHIDFWGHQRQCLSCHVGLSDSIRLQIYDENDKKWLEATYGRGDILLVRGYKYHRGTNHVEPKQPKLRAFYYIEDDKYMDLLRTVDPFPDGAVFNAGHADIDGFFEDQYKVDVDERAEQSQQVKAAKKTRAKLRRKKQVQALQCHKITQPNCSHLTSPLHPIPSPAYQ
jgi:hypothetical protein